MCDSVEAFIRAQRIGGQQRAFTIITDDALGGMVDVHDRWLVALTS